MGILSGTLPSRLLLCVVALLLPAVRAQNAATPLILPTSLAFDGAGNLYFTENGRHVIRRLSADGDLSIVAGTGTQGYAGDGGPATQALLDSPTALALDSAGDIYFSDAHNRCVRWIDSSGTIATYAPGAQASALTFDGGGNLVYADARAHQILRIDEANGLTTVVAGIGTQGYSGDGGVATSAAMDTVSGLVFDGSGNLFLSDTHNQRVRRVDSVTGIITTVAGTGQPGFAGDAGAATGAQFTLPLGLSLDLSGNLLIADAENQRIRRVDGVTGVVTTIAGTGVQTAAGDGLVPTSAGLNRPSAPMISAVGLMTIADPENGRVQQVNALGLVQTIAGVGAAPVVVAKFATTTSLAQAAGQTVTTSVGSSGTAATGLVTLLDGAATIATATLNAGVATFSIAELSIGAHTLTSRYGGDATHLASVSAPLVVTISGVSTADFAFTAVGAASVTMAAGGTANFSLSLTPTGAALTSPITLAVTGLPFGAVPTFAPAYLPPPGGPATVTLSVTTLAVAQAFQAKTIAFGAFALALPLILLRRRRGGLVLCSVVLLAGCGDRVTSTANAAKAATVYNVTVSATATSPSGGTLLHTVPLTLTIQ